jgi:hypothetical protein
MSRKIDITQPLSDADREYLLQRDRRDLIAMADAHARGEEVNDSMLTQGLPTAHDTVRLDPNTGDVNTLGRVLPGQNFDEDENAEWGEQPQGYDSWKVADLKAEIDRRNAERADAEDYEPISKSGKHADLVAALEADDEQYGDDESDEDDSDNGDDS